MSYQSTREDRLRAYLLGAVYVILAVILGVMLFKIWPPVPWPAPKDDEEGQKLAAFIAETGCPVPSPTPLQTQSPTPSPTPAANNTQTPNPTSAQSPAEPDGTNAGGSQPTGNTQTTTTTTGGTTSSNTAQTNPRTGVTVDRSGDIISIPINVFRGMCIQTTFDERLLLLVIVAGMLGAFVHGATSLADYIGNNNFNRNWTWFYLLRPAIGMALALVFYFVIRGGFLSTSGGAKDINPYGIAALAGLVGMFSKQATDKLSEVFGTLFRSAPGQGDAKRQDPLKPKTSGENIQVEPASVVAGSDNFNLTVTGTGFVNGATVHIDDVPQLTTFESATKLSAQVAKETVAKAVTLKITVVNPDNTKFGPVDLIVSAGGNAES